MSYLHRVGSTFGRLVPKPDSDIVQEDFQTDAVVPIQDQIENLRVKIGLKDRYNRVLHEELEASRQGASTLLQDLYIETRELRYRLLIALYAECTAVQHALRTHRLFQLGLSNRDTHHGIPWLDDKLFDTVKQWNVLLYTLTIKRRNLEDAEQMVVLLEQWPRPGSLPWELQASATFQELENTIEEVKVKRETMSILHSKYDEIKFVLRQQQGRYRPALILQESLLAQLKVELKSLQQMLDDAILFRDESYQNLKLTEKEAFENRRERRREMAKTNKMVTSLLKGGRHHHKDERGSQSRPSHAIVLASEMIRSTPEDEDTSKVEHVLKMRRAEAENYETKSRRLVEAMRVNDLTFIPHRLKMVSELGEYLVSEQSAKDGWRNTLIRQRDQLNLLLCQFRFTGQNSETQYFRHRESFSRKLALTRQNIMKVTRRQGNYGDAVIDVKLIAGAILQRFDLEDTKRRSGSHHTKRPRDLKGNLKQILSKLKLLMTKVNEFKEMFEEKEEDRNYGSFVRMPVAPPFLIRVEEPVIDEDYDDDDALPDLKVPTRLEIKLKSERFIQQALLRRGLH